MNLTDYPTPETDATPPERMDSHAEDFERRLAACREALERMQMWSTDPAAEELAKETLALTAPLAELKP